MRITIVGAGAIGMLLAARCAGHGATVLLIGRAEQVEAVRSRGVTVEGVGPGRWSVEAATTISPGRDTDLVLLTTKTFDLAEAARAAATAFASPAPTMVPQNGLGVEAIAAAGLAAGGWKEPGRILVRAVTSVPAMRVAPGVVRQPGTGEFVLTDPARAGPSGPATGAVLDTLRACDVPVRIVADLAPELWRKALVNAAINPVTALHRVPNGRLLEAPYAEEARTLLREAQRAAAIAGFAFSDREADRALDQVLRDTAGNHSSMLQDVERGHPTEIDAISGELLRVATAHGVDLPATRAVVRALSAGGSPTSLPAQPS